MTQEQIINQIINYLQMHAKGVRGYIGQEPYKSDFFRLFKEAYHRKYFDATSQPRLTGDSLREILRHRWFSPDVLDTRQRHHLMNQLCSRWDEWRYAWDRYEPEGREARPPDRN